MTEPYNMSQEQRDAAKIAALEKQLADALTVIKALATSTHSVRIHVDVQETVLPPDRIRNEMARYAARQLFDGITAELSGRSALYERLAQYEQWFYSNPQRAVIRTMR